MKCEQRSTFLDVYESQVVDYLATFTIPEDYRETLIALKAGSPSSVDDAEAQRRRLEAQMVNARTLFGLGDITKAEYLERRDRLQQTLNALKPDRELEETLERSAGFLADLPAAWHAATDEQRNSLARLLFEEVRIKDEWVAAVKPQPTFASFFDLDCQSRRLSSGSDGIRTRDLSLDRAAC